jgi:hypothetical protein
MLGKRGVIVAGIVTGLSLETAVHALTGRREAWDSASYWSIGLPAALVVSAVVGLASRGRDWIWTCVIVASQVATMMVRSGEISGLWPLTVMLSGILSAPFVAAAFVGSRFSRSPTLPGDLIAAALP